MEINADNYELLVDRALDYLLTDQILGSWADDINADEVMGRSGMALLDAVVLDSKWFISKMDVERVGRYAYEDGPSFAEDFCNRGERYGEAALSFSSRVKHAELAGKGLLELKDILADYLEKGRPLMRFLWPTHPISRTIEEQVRARVYASIDDAAQRDHALVVLTFPSRENTPVIENRELMKIALAIAKSNITSNSLDGLSSTLCERIGAHAERFGFLGARGRSLARWSAADFLARALEMAKWPDLPSKLEKSENEIANNKSDTARLMDELKFTEYERSLVSAAKRLVFFRTYRTEVAYHVFDDIENLLAEIGHNLGLSLQQMKLCSIDEILRSHKGSIDPSMLLERQRRFAIIVEGGRLTTADNAMLEGIERAFTRGRVNTSELKGTIASKGKAIGTARLVKTSREIHRVRPGDVLVTSMTTPDFVVGMQRAAAFVTDEGGMTCHAAIIAREMNKPCLIGTRHATQVFSDGDMLMVDADNGVVKVLQKA